jgi:hypothetical protein
VDDRRNRLNPEPGESPARTKQPDPIRIGAGLFSAFLRAVDEPVAADEAPFLGLLFTVAVDVRRHRGIAGNRDSDVAASGRRVRFADQFKERFRRFPTLLSEILAGSNPAPRAAV